MHTIWCFQTHRVIIIISNYLSFSEKINTFFDCNQKSNKKLTFITYLSVLARFLRFHSGKIRRIHPIFIYILDRDLFKGKKWYISPYILCLKLSKNRIISWTSWDRVKHDNYVLAFCIKMAWFVPIGYRVNKSKKTSFILHPFTLFFRLLNWYNTFISGMKSLSQTTT